MKSPFRIVFIFIILSFLGIISIKYLTIDFLPTIPSTTIQLRANWPGHTPNLIESEIIQKLENATSGINGLLKQSSVSRYNGGTITLEFGKGTDMDMVRFEVQTIIRRIYPALPSGAGYPIISDNNKNNNGNDNERPILVYSIRAAEQSFAIKEKVNDLFRKELSGFTDLQDIQLTGSDDLQLSISYDKEKCKALSISPENISAILQEKLITSYPGRIQHADGTNYFISVTSDVHQIRDIEEIPIPHHGGSQVRLKDIASVYFENKPINQYYRINGKNSISLLLIARASVNRLQLATDLKNKIKACETLLPAGYVMHLDQDETIFLREELNKNYKRSALALGILVLFLVFSYRSGKYLFILLTSLLVNLALTALCCWILGIPIHLYSIAGLAISFGIMIDNSIVTLDYFHQYKSRHVFLAVLAATLTTVAALLLVFLLPEEMKKNLTDFAAIVSVSLGVSLVVSLLFTPALYLLFYKNDKEKNQDMESSWQLTKTETIYAKIIAICARYRKSFIALVILLFGIPVFLVPTSWKDHSWYNKTLGHEWYLENVRPYIDKFLGGSLRLFIRDVYEKSGYRDPQRTRLYVSASMKHGTTVEQMNTILTEFEKYLEGIQGIDQYITSIYSGQNGYIDISFTKEYENSALPWQLKSRLTSKATDWSAVEWGIYGVGQGFSTFSNDQIPSFRVLMKGYNNQDLEKHADVLKDKLLKHPRIQKVNTNERLEWSDKASSEYILTALKKNMAMYAINNQMLYTTLQSMSLQNNATSHINIENKSYPLIIKEKKTAILDLWDITNTPQTIDSTHAFRLRDISKIELVPTTSAMHKEDRQYIRLVAFEYLGSEHFGSKYLEKVLTEMKAELPIGYTAERQTWRWGSKEKSKPYWLLVLMILVIFFICALMFEHLVIPFYIILMIPLSFVGLFLIFSWGDFYFDQGGYAAFVLLAGLVVNAAIFILHDYQQATKKFKHIDKNTLLIKAVSNRARTIILTTLSAICSLVPFLWEGQKEVFWFSLAVGVMGGLVFSMVGVFLVLEVLVWRRENKLNLFSEVT